MGGLMEEIKRTADRAVEMEELAGLNVLVMKNGKEIAYYETGYRDIENGIPVTRDGIYRLYSMSKPITACAAMILMERGVISLCEPVGKYIPEYMHTKVFENGSAVDAVRPIEIRDLLSMQSGIPYNNDVSESGRAIDVLMKEMEASTDTDHQMSTMEFVTKLSYSPFGFQPGTGWEYGLSADVMGAVIEKAGGMRFGEFLKKEIFEPLHMNDTGFFVPDEKKSRLAKTYRRIDGHLNEDPTTHLGISFKNEFRPNFESGGAGLMSTIDDYRRFSQMLLNGGRYGETRILRRKTVEYMTSSQLLPGMTTGWDSLRGYGYGNFMRVSEQPGLAYDLSCRGEYGWDGWLGCYFANLPEQKITILSMQQLCDSGTNSTTRKLRNVILSQLS